ncbi:MAG: hypothetical protein SGCHY_001063 [Lobulomycetales sp.]
MPGIWAQLSSTQSDTRSSTHTGTALILGSAEFLLDGGRLPLKYFYLERPDENAVLSCYVAPAASPLIAIPKSINTVAIVLDWKAPEHLLDYLLDAFQKLEAVDSVPSSVEAIFQESRKAYSDMAMANIDLSATVSSSSAPLGDGVLTQKPPVPIIVVVENSDNMSVLERESDFDERRFDFIQQSLRTICLSYGASLFYLSKREPESVELFKDYLAHLAFASVKQGAAGDAHHSVTFAVPFTQSAIIADRWAKIGTLGEGFDYQVFSQVDNSREAKRSFTAIVGSSKETSLGFNSEATIEVQDQQKFLEQFANLSSISSGVAAADPPSKTTTEDSVDASGSVEASESVSQLKAAGDDTGNEVLANFFQSLLSKKS